MGYLYSCNKNVPEFLVLSEKSLGTVYFVGQKLYNK